MTPPAGVLAQALQRERDTFGTDLSNLRERARDAIDWEGGYRAYPEVALSLAAVGGVILGIVSAQHARTSTRTGRLVRKATETLTSLAAAVAVDIVEELVPGSLPPEAGLSGSSPGASTY